jgi:hypothetical protein
MQPERPDFDDAISVIEELDPEHGGRGEGLRGDLLLGGLLLLVVALLVGWQWWHQDYQSSQYRAGQEAAGRSDLDAALHYYSEATGYSDADALAKNVREQIAERDRLYGLLVQYAAEGRWLPALRDIRAAARIQPGYRDLEAREKTALENVYADALGGTVALRVGADPPGLYYRAPSGWVWLEGSDQRSQVLGGGTPDRILFDAPNHLLPATPTPGIGAVNQQGDAYKGRRIVAAEVVSDALRYTPVPVDPSYFSPYVGGKDGFWAVRYADSALENEEYTNALVTFSLNSTEIVYQPYLAAAGAVVQLTATEAISTGSTIMAVDPGSNRYLLAEWTDASSFGPDEDTVINLYMAAAGESTKQLVYTLRGGSLQSAMLSPGGRYVVVKANEELTWAQERYHAITTSLIDTAEGGRTQMLATARSNTVPNYEPQETMQSAFVQRGAFAGKLLLAQHIAGTANGQLSGAVTNIRLIDPEVAMTAEQGDYTLGKAMVRVRGTVRHIWRIVEQDEDGLVLIGRSQDNESYFAPTQRMIVFQLGREPEIYDMEANGDGQLLAAGMTGCHIIWTNQQYEGEGKPVPVRSVYSMHRPGEGESESNGEPRQVFTTRGEMPAGGHLYDSFNSINLGEKVLAYIRDGELHARTYEGEVDLMLENGVSTIFEDDVFSYYAGLLQ